MEGLINYQRDIYKRMKKIIVNFKKSPKECITESYVETRLEIAEQIWVEFTTTHKNIFKEFKWEDIKNSVYSHENIYESTEEIYTNYKSLLKEHLKSFDDASNNDTSLSVNKDSRASSSLVKLPKITIPTFSGNYNEWMSFRDLFVSLIHLNKDLDDVQKMHYLRGHLTGEAELLVRQIPVTSANYMQCWQQLENRFSNKRYISNCILNKLFSQKGSNVESASVLKELLNTTTDCINGLKNLEIDIKSWDILIIHLVNHKLDPETRKQWELSVSTDSSNDLPSLEKFTKFLTFRFHALECAELNQKLLSPNVKNTLNTFHVSHLSCELCSASHKICFCNKFKEMDYNSRNSFVLKNRMCINCLGGNHMVEFCRISTNCKICNKRHHSLLHPPSTDFTVKHNSPKHSSFNHTDPPLVACFSRNNNLPKALLPTALVQVQSSSNNHHIVRSLVDQGSQSSFISSSLVHKLGLKKIPVTSRVTGIGQNSTQLKFKVHLKIKSLLESNPHIQTEAYILNDITDYIPPSVPAIDWAGLGAKPMADPYYDSSGKIDILLGAGVYGQIMQEGIIKLPGCPTAQRTSLGWVISGEVNSDRVLYK